MIHLVNYADEKFRSAQKFNTKTALDVGECDNVFECNPSLIEPRFATMHSEILNAQRGGGYWLWKPYFIRKHLNMIGDGDSLIYSDSGAYFKRSVKPLVALHEKFSQDIIPFELELLEGAWTKRDAFFYMECDGRGYELTYQRLASFMVVKKTKFSLDFFDQYVEYCCDKRISTDLNNSCGLSNFPNFQDHRHDQSVFSLLTKKIGLTPFRDPSQWGLSRMDQYPNSNYGQIFEHTRDKKPKEANALYRLKKKLLGRS